MEAATATDRPVFTVIENPLHGFGGELTEANMHALVDQVTALHDQLQLARGEIERLLVNEEGLNNDLKGKRLRIAELAAEREEKALASPERPKVEALHALHAQATRAAHDADKAAATLNVRSARRKALDATERENAAVCVRKLGFRGCVKAVVGITFDPSWSNPRRNGTRECFNTFELCFRNTAKATSCAERAPLNWEPDVERIAAITGVEPAKIEEWLS